MNFLDAHKRKLEGATKKRIDLDLQNPIEIPEGVFVQCSNCHAALYEKVLKKNQHVCPVCQNHFRIDAKTRLEYTVDEGSFEILFDHLLSTNPLHMPGYEEKLIQAQKSSHINEAFVCGKASIVGYPCAIGILDSHFMMGSMGSVVGEKVTRLIELSTKQHLPLIIFSASGGARMQEGILSLMQMAKTSAAIKHLDDSGGLFISVMTHPTTGGVAASFASLGDYHIAEKSSLIGFAGPRVIKQTIREELPEGFQTAEFQLQSGQVDIVLHRQDIRKTLFQLLKFHQKVLYDSL